MNISISTAMVPEVTQSGPTRSKVKLAALVILFVALAFVFARWQAAYVGQLRADKGELAASKACQPSAIRPNGCRDLLLNAIGRAPLSSDALAGLVRIDTLRGSPAAERKRGESLLKQLGFRSTLAQQLLIESALKRRDFADILLRSDALLRREKLQDDVLPIMVIASGDRSTREPLITALAREPSWRLAFMTHEIGFARPELRAVRAEVLGEMIARKLPVDRIEVAYAVRALSKAQENITAYQLWKRYNRIEDRQFVVFDPRFRAIKQEQIGGNDMPFEWLLLKGRGYRAQLRPSTRQNTLALSWNGRGAPVVLEQKIALTAERRYKLDILATEPAAVIASRFSITLDCPGRAPVAFVDFQPAQKPGQPETVTAREAVGCDFPVLRVRGNAVDSGDRGGKANITYLNVSPALVSAKA
jgi:hypothetical protein